MDNYGLKLLGQMWVVEMKISHVECIKFRLLGCLLACDVCVYFSVQFQLGFIFKVDMVIL